MAVSAEHKLLSLIIQNGVFEELIKLRITESMFNEPDYKEVYRYLDKYYKNKRHPGVTPTPEHMQEKFCGFRMLLHDRESVKELSEVVRENEMSRRLFNAGADISELIDIQPYKALDKLKSSVLSIQQLTSSTRDLYLHEMGKELISDYLSVKNAESILGIPYPWDGLNIETQGMHDEELIIIFGRLKSMKSFIGTIIAMHAYNFCNRRVMFHSAEMPRKQALRRLAAALAEIDYRRLKHGKLLPHEEEAYIGYLNSIDELEEEDSKNGRRKGLMVSSDKDSDGAGGVLHIKAKAKDFKPDLIVVDSFYRLFDDRTKRRDYDWRVQSNIVQDLKHMAQELGIPVVGITQASRKGEGQDNIEGMSDASYADAMGQETDLGMRVVKKSRDVNGVNIKVDIAAAREIQADGFNLKLIPYTRCTFEGWFTRDQEGSEERTDRKRTAVKRSELTNKHSDRQRRNAAKTMRGHLPK